MPTMAEIKEDKEFVEGAGLVVSLLNKDRARATYYRPDGAAVPNYPADPYHRALARRKGWTLAPPVVSLPEGTSVEVVAPIPLAEAKPIPKPPLHIHVMQPEIGAPCLVAGCNHKRVASSLGLARRGQKGKKEASNA